MVMTAADDDAGYAKAAESYLHAGWRGALPLTRGHKGGREAQLPVGFTGHEGADPSYADIMQWIELRPLDNLCVRLPDGVIGIDVDHYGAKAGGKTLAEAVRRWGPLPTAPRSTSREDDFISGIRLFRVAPGTMLDTKIAFSELGIGDIEIIQRHHRYVVAWPSIHPEGRSYWWRNDANQLIGIPTVDELPELPSAWIDGLKVQPRAQLDDDALRYDVKLSLTAGDPSIAVGDRLRQAVKELNLPGASRHDTCTKHVMALARLGKSGESGVEHAMRLLCDVFEAVTGSDGKRGPGEARSEFIRMLTNKNIARELSKPGIDDWFRALIPEYDSTPSSGGIEGVEAGAASHEAGNLTAKPNSAASPRSALEEIEQGFWESRESLAMVYQTSMAKMCPPWAVLAQCAARGLAQVRPCVTLPDIIGGPGSLNWFTAIVAPSGRGKGASGACARLLVPESVIQRNLGTGEGILDAYIKPANKETGDPRSVHESVLLTADEVDTLTALKSRSGSTLMGILRSGFSGETLGFSYRSNATHLEAHTYRMTMILSVQPEKADWIIADSVGGTPQRLMWFPATDSRISKKRPWPSSSLTLPSPREWQYRREIIVPREALDLLEDAQVDRNNDAVDALDGHALFCREKFAYALTVLDGRIEMTSEDWELSGIAAEISLYTRERTIEAIRVGAQMDALDRGEVRGVELAAAEAAKAHEQADRTRRILRWVLSVVEAAGDGGVANRVLKHKIHSRDRRYLDGAVNYAASSGLIRQLEGTTTWVKI